MTFNDEARAHAELFQPTHEVRLKRDIAGHKAGDIIGVTLVPHGGNTDEPEQYATMGGHWLRPSNAELLGPIPRPDPVRAEMLKIAPSGQIETGVKETNPKDAVGSRKLPWHVIPFRVLAGVVLAFFGGALKYRAFNYRIAGVRASVYIDAAIRHILRFAEGEDWDPDVKGYNKEDPSKGVLIHHIDEAIAGLMVLRDSMLIGNWTDDRAPSISPSWIDEANEMAGRIIDANPDPKRNWTQSEVVKARAVAAALEAFDNTGPAPATPAPASIVPVTEADTPEPVPPAPFLPPHDAEPGPLSPDPVSAEMEENARVLGLPALRGREEA